MNGFEGSYMGANDRISDLAIMECKICWTPYDPAVGDEYRQVLAGTPFRLLPEDWHCPTCDAPKAQFMVREDAGAPMMQEAREIEAKTQALVADFTEVWHSKMREVPLVNKALRVEAVGFQAYEGGVIGVLFSPWFMNLIALPGAGEDWSGLVAGTKEVISFPSGDYEFLHNSREMTGPYKACSLFSPMADFTNQMQAADVARAIMAELFKPENRAETDRAAEIRAMAEGPAEEEAEPAPTRRKLITAGLEG